MQKRQFAIALFATALAVEPAPSSAGSPVPYPLLGRVDSVHLMVSGDLGFDPIPGLDKDDLLEKIRERCERSLELAELKIEEPPDAYLLVTVDHAWHRRAREMVALLVSTELSVLAEPVDGAKRPYMHGRPTMSIWSNQELELGPSSEAVNIVLEALDSSLERLLEDRRSAQDRAGPR